RNPTRTAARVLASLVILGAILFGFHSHAVRAAAQSAVTVTSASLVDPARSTPAREGVPGHPARTIHELVYDPVGIPGPLPTVVFAPGWNSQASVYDALLRAMASAGFLVVGVDSPGSSSYFPGVPYWDVAGEDISTNTIDLSAALTNVESGPWAG